MCQYNSIWQHISGTLYFSFFLCSRFFWSTIHFRHSISIEQFCKIRFHLCILAIVLKIDNRQCTQTGNFDRLKNRRNISCCSNEWHFSPYSFSLLLDSADNQHWNPISKWENASPHDIFYLNDGTHTKLTRYCFIYLLFFFFFPTLNDISYCSFVSCFFLWVFFFLLFYSNVWFNVFKMFLFSLQQHTKSKQNHCRNGWFGGVLNQRFHLENLACHYGKCCMY